MVALVEDDDLSSERPDRRKPIDLPRLEWVTLLRLFTMREEQQSTRREQIYAYASAADGSKDSRKFLDGSSVAPADQTTAIAQCSGAKP